ncbi:phosphoglycerate mutase-like protein [Auricularia subglabra TFB-10046 SS5]|uniref:Phosphoglycerate mutase-like protein n=1 Tax=Auricularia subglabra (strain TFB-10046 / SS5) TaxID=717982 RepID=J0WVJ6_AURST|nr:phosphoglycerate mutase-like protein [Auricularia subglabra TFB-10046 SS5]
MTVTIYFVRHGQSEDNLRSIWAGWKDAPLSALGLKQAAALGEAFANTPITAIFASDLKRAHSTALALHGGQPEDAKPPFTVTTGLREQHFGKAEGRPWDAAAKPEDLDVDNDIFPILTVRDEKFPEGESLNDLRERAARDVLDALLIPHIWKARGKDADETRLACVSHGLCISELCAAIVARAPDFHERLTFAGLYNTAWHCLRIGVKDETPGMATDDQMDVHAQLTIEVVKMNDSTHLDNITRNVQPEEESELREYLSGKAA